MNVLVRFMRLFNKNKGRFEIWDTSAVSLWLNRLKDTLKKNSNTTIVIPEGVVHELSVGRHKYENCRIAYEFIMACNSERLVRAVPKDKILSWTIDQQVVATARKYHRKGYDAVLVTCDKNEEYTARMRGLRTELLPSLKHDDVDKTAKPVAKTEKAKTPVSVKVAAKMPAKEKTKLEETPQVALDEFSIPCVTKGKQKFIDVNLKIAVYEPNGKRRIGKNDWLPINITDKIEYLNSIYEIISFKDNSITLKKKVKT